MSVLYRVSTRTRKGIIGAMIKSRSGAASADVVFDAYFGMIATGSAGQGAQSFASSASAASQAAYGFFGQGSQSAAAVCNISSDVVADTAQGQTFDSTATVPFISVVETGQADQSVAAVITLPPYRTIEPGGWLDGAIVTPNQTHGLWRLSTRSSVSTIAAQVTRTINSGAGADVAADAYFVYDYNTYADGFGAPLVQFGNQVISGTGFDDSAFGSHVVFNLTQYVSTPGIASEEAFGAASVFKLDQFVAVDGMRDDAFGVPSIENLNKTVYPQRIDPTLVFGTAEVIGPRYISGATVGDGSAIGDHAAAGSRTVYPSGVASATAFGTGHIAFSTRDVRPTSIQIPSNQVPAALIGNAARDMDIYGIGNEDVGMGDPIIGEPPFDVIWGAGVGDASEFGEHDFDMIGATRRIRPGWPINNPSIRTEFGTARIIPHTIHPTNVNTPAYGRPVVSNKIRYIDLSVGERGISSMRIGTHWVSNYIRYVQPAGFDHSEVWWPFGPVPSGQAAAVRHVSDGKLYPGSVNDGAFGEPTVRVNLC